MDSIVISNLTKKYRIAKKEYSLLKKISCLINKKYDYLTALNDVSFSVKKGEIFGILGPNGAGKTTLIKVISGLLLPDSGSCRVDKYDILKEREKVRTSVNILMSGGWIIFDYKLSVYDNLKFWASIEGVPRKNINETVKKSLEMIDLIDRKDDYPENLSAGLRQRMNLARCIVSERPLYLLDEPTANVDPYSAVFIRNFIKKLKDEGKTIIFATHNLWEAEELCDRIAILNRGKIIELDDTKSLKNKLSSDLTIIELEKISNELIKKIKALNYVSFVEKNNGFLKIYGSIKQNMPEIIDVCKKYSKVKFVDIKEPSLNDIFIKLISSSEENK